MAASTFLNRTPANRDEDLKCPGLFRRGATQLFVYGTGVIGLP